VTKQKSFESEQDISRDHLAKLLNEDLSREYQAIISYVVYSQVLKGAEFMSIAAQLELHAQQELKHALIISRQIDYLGKMPTVTAKPVRTSEKAKEMLRFDLARRSATASKLLRMVRASQTVLSHIIHDPRSNRWWRPLASVAAQRRWLGRNHFRHIKTSRPNGDRHYLISGRSDPNSILASQLHVASRSNPSG